MDTAEIAYPTTAGHFRVPSRSDNHPEYSFRMLDVASAKPSIKPIVHTRTPSTFARKRGRTFSSISLETSVRKLVPLVAQTLRWSLDLGVVLETRALAVMEIVAQLTTDLFVFSLIEGVLVKELVQRREVAKHEHREVGPESNQTRLDLSDRNQATSYHEQGVGSRSVAGQEVEPIGKRCIQSLKERKRRSSGIS